MVIKVTGNKWAFIGGFVWIASWIILIVSTVSKIWIMLSTTISGADQTSQWRLGGFNSTETIGLLSIGFFCIVTFVATKGLTKVAKLAAVGGIAAVVLTIFFCVASLVLLAKNGFQLAEPINLPTSLLKSPRSSYQSLSSIVSFLIFAIYAYAGIEALGGVSDKMKNSKRNFPLAMALGAFLITMIYALFIFLWGASANWSKVFNGSGVNLGNTTYVLMSNLGYSLGQQFSLGTAGAQTLSFWFARFGSFAMLISYLGSFFVIVYMPIKSFILGTPKELWPKALPKLNTYGMPANAMWLQAGVVSVLIALTSFGGKSAVSFYNVLTLMDNLSSTLPYLFLVTAFPFFKANTTLERPFVFYKRKWVYITVTIVVDLLLMIGVASTAISAISESQYWNLTLELIGPLFFGMVGYVLFRLYRKRSARTLADAEISGDFNK
ncbi:glutamate/gamma-aminobutyrate family transporter YjeM [Lentilactobacillus kisonensis]|uniref:glutamate/gamma-aminobutyrate family transporter YjeM n=1 Tax=Lentilactobacillus kisonensis TaxID=481722 RepID=UPI001FB3F823|nr:glutamate/gamma-aminobutyrate family transporter YjeM [Lentilactobacillus kisonensis]